MIAFAATVGNGASHISFFGNFRRSLAPTAPINVASVPKITSHITPLVKRFAIAHPSVSPSVASGRRIGRIQSISESLNWMMPLASPTSEER